MKKFIAVLLTVMLSVSMYGCGTSPSTSSKDTSSASTSSTSPKRAMLGEITSTPSSENEESTSEGSSSSLTDKADAQASSESSGNTVDLDTAMTVLHLTLTNNFGKDNYTLEYDDTQATVNIWTDGIAMGATLAASGDTDAKEAWNTVIEGQKSLCKSIAEQAEKAGAENYYVLLNVLNDIDKSKTLLSILNGTVIYNAVQDSSVSSAADEASSVSSSSIEISPEDWATGNVPSSAEASSNDPEASAAAPQQESKPGTQPKKSSGGGGENADNFNTYDNPEQQQTEDAWVLNLNSKKIHYPHCSEVKKIAPKNYSTSNLSESELLNQGYTTCGRCH